MIRTHLGVADVAVVGVVDEKWGERVCAAVIMAPDVSVSDAELRAWCRERLAPYRVPKTLIVVDELPRNAMGKVLKRELAAVFTDASSMT